MWILWSDETNLMKKSGDFKWCQFRMSIDVNTVSIDNNWCQLMSLWCQLMLININRCQCRCQLMSIRCQLMSNNSHHLKTTEKTQQKRCWVLEYIMCMQYGWYVSKKHVADSYTLRNHSIWFLASVFDISEYQPSCPPPSGRSDLKQRGGQLGSQKSPNFLAKIPFKNACIEAQNTKIFACGASKIPI